MRDLSAAVLALILASGLAVAPPAAQSAAMPISGPDVPGIASYDRRIVALMRDWQIPGVSIAVTRNGKLIVARGYGWADREAGIATEPTSAFRIGSLAKPITAAAILHLVDEGRLSLNARFLDLLPRYQLPTGGEERLRSITVAQLLRHTGGWDRHASGDPMIDRDMVRSAADAPSGRGCDAIIALTLHRRLDFAPDTSFAYSNFGYCILGRIVEQITARPYDAYVKDAVLRPMGIEAMQIGRTRLEGRAPGEVKYYDYPGAPTVVSVFPTVVDGVPAPYGGFFLEAMDSHGAWIGSAIDLARFLTAIDGWRGPSFLSKARLADMTARSPAAKPGDVSWYGMGWYVDVHGTWWHTGSLPGASSAFAHTADGYAWVMLANSRPLKNDEFFDAVDQAMWDALNEKPTGSPTDLFAAFPSRR